MRRGGFDEGGVLAADGLGDARPPVLRGPADALTAQAPAQALVVEQAAEGVGERDGIVIGHEESRHAVAHLRERERPVRLLIIGGDTDESLDGHEASLRERAERLGLGRSVAFLGPQRQSDLRTYYVAADVVVMPSYYESFGMVALEAMACGSPVIGSRVGGLATTVRDGITGFLVPEGDAVALADRIADVVSDPALRARLGWEGVRWAAQHRWPCVAEAVCREYARFEPRAEPHLAAARCRE